MTGNNSCLLDTCIIVDIFRNKLSGAKIDRFPITFISSITIGELYTGTFRSTNRPKKIKEIEDFVKNCTILPIDHDTAKTYSEIKNRLKLKGKPIPENDIWIAASALQHDLILYTHDQHFKEIDSLSLINQ